MKKRTKAQRSAAAKAAWAKRKEVVGHGGPWVTPRSFKEVAHLLKGVQGVAGEVAGPIPVVYTLQAEGYHALAHELHAAFEQSAHGKGKERHANGRPFERQPILELTRLYGPGFSAGQAAKKAQEALGMAQRGETDKAVHEVHGAIVYLAAVAHFLRTSGGG